MVTPPQFIIMARMA